MTRRLPFDWLLYRGVGEGATPSPRLLHFTLDMYLMMLSVKLRDIKYHFFKSLVWSDLGLNPGLPDHWWDQKLNTLENISISLIWFCGISTFVGYLMSNHLYTYMICKYIVCKKTFLNEPKLIFCTQLNGYTYDL